MHPSTPIATTSLALAPSGTTAPKVMARDTAGTVWAHSNPAELYRWIARRNDLLGTIAVASRRGPASWSGLRPN